ncbi:hypothetical protein B0H13DRAFT_2369551 [Mycena leptocephala]|nr:hypothetical protein B0H13DRAFT_2369551 [Mycena leptocephala]
MSTTSVKLATMPTSRHTEAPDENQGSHLCMTLQNAPLLQHGPELKECHSAQRDADRERQLALQETPNFGETDASGIGTPPATQQAPLPPIDMLAQRARREQERQAAATVQAAPQAQALRLLHRRDVRRLGECGVNVNNVSVKSMLNKCHRASYLRRQLRVHKNLALTHSIHLHHELHLPPVNTNRPHLPILHRQHAIAIPRFLLLNVRIGSQRDATTSVEWTKVVLAPLGALPAELETLFTEDSTQAKEFRKNIAQYNTALSFTSVGVCEDRSINNGGGPPIFRIHGELCHCSGVLLPSSGTQPTYAQLYIYESRAALDHRIQNNTNLRRDTMEILQHVIGDNHQFAPLFRHAHEVLADAADNADDISVRLRVAPGVHGATRQSSNMTSFSSFISLLLFYYVLQCY